MRMPPHLRRLARDARANTYAPLQKKGGISITRIRSSSRSSGGRTFARRASTHKRSSSDYSKNPMHTRMPATTHVAPFRSLYPSVHKRVVPPLPRPPLFDTLVAPPCIRRQPQHRGAVSPQSTQHLCRVISPAHPDTIGSNDSWALALPRYHSTLHPRPSHLFALTPRAEKRSASTCGGRGCV